MASQLAVQGALRLFLYVATATLLVTVLAVAQAVLIPIALAAMIAFILNTPVAALEGRGLPRAGSVAAVLFVALALLAAFGYALTWQFTDFTMQMPQYSVSIKSKLATLRETRRNAFGKIEDTVAKVSQELDKQAQAPHTEGEGVQPVVVVSAGTNDVERLRLLLEPVLRPIATGAVVLVLTGFMLMRREDLRNRLIRLVGRARITVTTRTLDEAGQRISTFLFTQSVINAGFGICIAVGLFAIGVPYALLWGVTAAFLRFVPYLGAILALVMPTAIAFLGSAGWGPTIETVVLFVALDAVTANLIEPVWIGAHTGISSLALLITTMFWTWVWGPVGLLLSTPLTVCLVAIGKHVPWMGFLAVLLGDEPPLEPYLTLYQRLLAGDEDEASDILDHELTQAANADVFDRVISPTLLQAGRDRLRDDISAAEHEFVTRTIRDILINRNGVSPALETLTRDVSVAQRKMLGVPARNDSDALALAMVAQLADASWTVEELTTATLASEILQAIERRAPDVLYITGLPPGGLNHVRYLCKRIHSQFPRLPIWVLRTDGGVDSRKIVDQLVSDGAQHVATSFAAATTQLGHDVYPAAESAQTPNAGLDAASGVERRVA